jgi:predicted TIM-barrel fold metal-dependent hydrolase
LKSGERLDAAAEGLSLSGNEIWEDRPMDGAMTDPRGGRDSAGKLIKPVSADSHVLEPPNCYVDYIDPAFRERAPVIRQNPATGGDAFYIEGFAKPVGLGLLAAAGVDSRDIAVTARFEDLHRGGWDPKARLADQDRDGVQAEFVYPTVGMLICNHPDDAFKTACIWAYNRWLQEFVGGAPGRLYGIGQITISSVEQAIRDLQRIKDMGFKGVMMPGDPDTEEDYDDPAFDPFWQAAIALELPISFHILTGGLTKSFVEGTAAFGGGVAPDKRTLRAQGVRGADINQSFSHVRMCQDILGMLVWGRVFERNPGLKVVCVEADAGWAPHYMYRMDHFYDRHRHWKKLGDMQKMPSEYFAENIYLTFQDDWSAFKVAHAMNPRRLLWANDFPHSDSTWPWSQEMLERNAVGVTAEERAWILRDNTAELYKIPVA